jgi:sterol desaturase/sphingolipid hydroxylase (fatty acid hydroxylase superfamily)
MGLITAALAGAATWTLAEYVLHGGLMHKMRGRGLASKEHLRHHADVTYFSPASKKAASAVAGSILVVPVATTLMGARRAAAYTGGLIGMYLSYELLHRRVHTHPPRTSHGRWMRRNHLHHHFGTPMGNFGVTTGVWDRAFGSHTDPDVVVVPRRMAPTWLLDDLGEVRPEYAAEYRAKGHATLDAAQVEQDRERAWANEAPEPA